jgi:hypothetical protein
LNNITPATRRELQGLLTVLDGLADGLHIADGHLPLGRMAMQQIPERFPGTQLLFRRAGSDFPYRIIQQRLEDTRSFVAALEP